MTALCRKGKMQVKGEERLKNELRDLGVQVRVYALLDSTNAEARRQATEAISTEDLSPRLLVAREQSAGRGRLGRSFLSRKGRGIYLSLLYFTSEPLGSAVSVTTAAAAIVAKAIEAVSGVTMRIKWVNDLYNDRGKVCGILAETVSFGTLHAVILGVGINVGADDFPPELVGIASSVEELAGREEELIVAVTRGLLAHAADPRDHSYMADYRSRFMLVGQEVELLRAGSLADRGTVLGVTDDGGLLYRAADSGEIRTLHSGEVSLRPAAK